MKTLQILPLCAAVALAHSHSHHEAHAGICGGARGVPSLLTDSDPICQSSFLDSGKPRVEQPGHVQHGNGQSSNANRTAHQPEHGHRWTSSSPCFITEETHQEFCVFTDTTFAENRGTTVVTTPERAAYLQQIPAFTNPNLTRGTNQDILRTIPAKYKVGPIPGKGLGATATTFISRGELIMANTASLLFDYAANEDLSQEDYLAIQAAAIDSLPDPHRQVVLGMSTHDEADNLTHVELVEKLTSTNAFDIDPEEEDPDQENKYFTIFPEIARMNHDCRPNADYYFDFDTLTQWVHAVRDIYPGEEITVTYIDPTMTQASRAKKLLGNWGFQCSCPSCTASKAAIAASDDRLRQIERLRPEFDRYWKEPSSRATPQMAELMVGLYEQEKLWGMMEEAYRYAAVEWNGVGEPWAATRYARLAVEYGIYSSGERDGNVQDMDELASDPWGHWSWMFRTRERMGWPTPS